MLVPLLRATAADIAFGTFAFLDGYPVHTLFPEAKTNRVVIVVSVAHRAITWDHSSPFSHTAMPTPPLVGFGFGYTE
jgi:hypothetical protein